MNKVGRAIIWFYTIPGHGKTCMRTVYESNGKMYVDIKRVRYEFHKENESCGYLVGWI